MMHLIIHMFNTSMIPYISFDQYLKPQFIQYTKYAKYAFLLLFSILGCICVISKVFHIVDELFATIVGDILQRPIWICTACL